MPPKRAAITARRAASVKSRTLKTTRNAKPTPEATAASTRSKRALTAVADTQPEPKKAKTGRNATATSKPEQASTAKFKQMKSATPANTSKRRGRPPKASGKESAIEKDHDTQDEAITEERPVKKRGRPPKSSPSAPTPSKAATASTMGTSQIEKVTKRQPKPETDGTPAPSRGRGRPPKKVTETPAETEKARPGRKKRPAPTEDEDEADKEANGLTETAEPEPKRQRGRPSLKAVAHDEKKDEANEESPSYWLMKAEPESRLEKGIDVKFSIDDLEAATEPEPWNGVRNHVAKNNMKAMKKGERAFFYHSNCKTPGIVGIMEIVQEASPDESAFVETDPYYDPKAKRDNPTGWVVVHVEFRQKFDKPVTLEQLKNSAKDNKEIENMQLLKQSRLSVSKVSSEEWGFILRQAGAEIIPDKVDEVMNLSKNPPEVDGIATNSATLGLAPTQESKSSGRATSVPAPTKHSSAHPKKAGPRAGSRAQSVPPSAPTPETGPAGPHSETPISQAMARVVEEQET